LQTPVTAITDEKILDLMTDRKTQERGFRLLMEQYQEKLYWHVRRLVVDHDDANDVLQNCLIKAYRSIGSFRRKSALYTWLYRIATNEAITFLKKKKRKATASLDGEESEYLVNQLQADHFFDGDTTQLLLQRALHSLPEKQRAVFNLRYYEEMPYQQISEVLGASVGALKASYHHAVKKIELYLKEKEIS